MTSRKIKIGLLGAGYWGKNLLRVLNQAGVLDTVCDLDKNILKEKKREYPNIKVTDNFSDILNNKDITAVEYQLPPLYIIGCAKKR
jgi:UDP-2-acetamido-3-amino-2,3-dideoxy-glucuronate N-acetyltransferase